MGASYPSPRKQNRISLDLESPARGAWVFMKLLSLVLEDHNSSIHPPAQNVTFPEMITLYIAKLQLQRTYVKDKPCRLSSNEVRQPEQKLQSERYSISMEIWVY